MAFSAVLSSFCTPKTQSCLYSSPKPTFTSQTTSLLRPRATQKFLLQSTNHKMISPIVVNPRRSLWKVKASEKEAEEKRNKSVKVFDTKDELAEVLARDVYDLSQKFIKERGFFTVVLCGGSFIKHLRKLVEPPFVDSEDGPKLKMFYPEEKKIDWSKWHFFWVEERVLPKDHMDSSFRIAYDRFFSKVPNLDMNKNVHSINGYELPTEKAAERLEKEIKVLMDKNVIASSETGFPKFDLMLLDMGKQGNPDYLSVDGPRRDGSRWITFTKNFSIGPKERIAFTLPVINASSNIAMVVTGQGKTPVVFKVLKLHDRFRRLRVQEIDPEQGEMKWYLDSDAATDPWGDSIV